MVAKISHSDNLYGILLYNQNKVDQGEAEVLYSKDIFHSPDNKYNVSDCLKSFDIQLIANNRTKNPAIHISLNPDPKDNIDDNKAQQIANEYLSKMGYSNQPYILYKHKDIERIHYHIVTVCVDENGNKINDKFEKRRSMNTCRSLEKKFNLSLPTKKQLFEESLIKPVDYTKGDLSKQLRNTIFGMINNYKFKGMSEFKTLLELHNVSISEIKGRIESKEIDGITYSALDDTGRKVGKPLKATYLDKKFQNSELKKLFFRNKKAITNRNLDFIRKVTIQCMYQCKDRSREELKSLLKNRGIDMVLNTNKDGRTYGITYIDHHSKTVIKGADLGKEYSANVMNNFFDNPYFIITKQLENKGIDAPTKENEIDGTFLRPYNNYDASEEAFKRKMRKRKKF